MPVDPDWFIAQGDDAPFLLSAYHHKNYNDIRYLGVAVSGGGDSMALLHAYMRLTAQTGQALSAVTVDHGLRPESADEAQMVAEFCHANAIPHDVLRWERSAKTGNLQDQARRGRYALMARWAQRHDITDVVVGHTADDQAETFLMRLARSSGIDGLSGMRRTWIQDTVRFHRPFLGHGRAALRDYSRRNNVPWVDDPSNDDGNYERIKARRALKSLTPLGITTQTLNTVTHHLFMERAIIQTHVLEAGRQIMSREAGDVIFQREGLAQTQPETMRRLLIQALMWVASAEYPPREQAVQNLQRAVEQGQSKTLGGCRITVTKNDVRISRELRAVRGKISKTRTVWDGRWRMKGPHDKKLEIGALGPEGLRQCPEWRATGLPRASLVATPAVWRGEDLIAAPIAGLPNGWTAQIVADFHSDAFAH